MRPRNRVVGFGGSALMIVAGTVLGLAGGGIAAEATGIALTSLGAIGVVSLAFLEVGLSEDRDRLARSRALPRRRPPARRRRPD